MRVSSFGSPGEPAPSSLFEPMAEALAHHGLRKRVPLQLSAEERESLPHRLAKMGHACNEDGDHAMAHSFFESAYAVKHDVTHLISATNMRLRLGEITLAIRTYERLKPPDFHLSPAQREIVARKLAEATAAEASRARAPWKWRPLEDEVMQLLRPRRTGLDDAEAVCMARTMRRQGHVSNESSDVASAQLWFDCAYVVGRESCDLLSAANMRLKLDGTSGAAQVRPRARARACSPQQ